MFAIDPSSPFSGGAILGDRIRMQRHAPDEGVLSDRWRRVGTWADCRARRVKWLRCSDAMGFDVVMSSKRWASAGGEVDVVALADTKVVVTVPGLGDEVQAITWPGSGNRRCARRKQSRSRRCRSNGADLLTMPRAACWQAPLGSEAPSERCRIVRTVAVRGEGIPELAAAIGPSSKRRPRIWLRTDGHDGPNGSCGMRCRSLQGSFSMRCAPCRLGR